jgi:glycerol-3-phosphate acyltransferase PlsY
VSLESGLLIGGAYLLGAVPAAYLAGKWSRGIDIRQHGSGNVGATNLLRFTSRRVAAPVIVFDLLKGMVMVVVAWRLGFGLGEQAVVGVAAVIGHNWPVFLRFSGGRGVITTMGVGFILPLINGLVTWQVSFLITIAYVVIALITAHFKALPLGVLIIIAAFPVVGWLFTASLPVTLGSLGMVIILAVRRLTAPQPVTVSSISKKRVLLNRLFFDRDVKEKGAWLSLVLEQQEKQRKV